ncbi:WD40 repeat-like protein, partial [Dichomitus squalens LYAD-421 SS1]|uniref:WD40 repeat-like protein n=1 Tax=Dichomitus squalens (strain LYAD-421) TaxID=732165 RepID=UPI000441186E
WKPVLERVKIFASLIEDIGDLHPYAKIASKVLLSVVKVGYKRDNAMADLLEAMNELYGLVNKTGRLSDLDEYRRRLLRDMSSKTEECAKFIQDEARFTNFWMRTGSNVLSGSRIDEKVRDFTEAFVDLRRSFTEAGVLETEIRVANLADSIALYLSSFSPTVSGKIDNLTHVRGAGLDSGRACLEGTRVKTLGALRDWINNSKADAPRVLFLLGGAGTGKSSIAHSIGVHSRDRRRLGACFTFNRTFQAERPPKYVFSTIAHDLANWDPAFRHALANVLHDQGDLVGSVDIAKQWEGLILEPLKRVDFVGPVVVVVDAFDESSSADAPERRLLLKLLAEGSRKLPSNFRILITSRLEHDVAFRAHLHDGDHQHVSHISLDDNKEEATSDIALYVRHQLAPDRSLADEALHDGDYRLLVTKAEGLFQWAATACRVLLQNPAGLTLRERLNLRLGGVLGGGPFSLDDLYRSILEQHFDLDEPVLAERFRSVMAQILCASSPLSIDSLDEMRRLATGGKRDEITLVVQYMGPLLSGVSSRTSPIRPLHTSFRDFLTDATRSGEWFVDLAPGHSTMVLGCFRVMNNRLLFNICRLETSYVSNRDIPDLEARLSMHVPQSLSYAAGNWKDHLATTHPPDLQQELGRFLQEKLLFWFELLSLLKCVNRAAPSLEAVLKGYNGSGSASSKELLIDAISFSRRFAGVIAYAAPHVYISALPFSPASSRVRTNYLPCFPFLPVVNSVHDRWPHAHTVLSRHTDSVSSVAYSPDGRRIVSGSHDTMVRIWDAETGEAILEQSCGSSVRRLALSPDGRHIATALHDSTVRIWDSTTGEAVCAPLRSHEGSVECIAYSPDGHCIVSGDCNGRVCIWSTETFGMVHKLAPHGHATFVRCVAFSPTGRYIAFSYYGVTVGLWDTTTQCMVGKRRMVDDRIGGHNHVITSVFFMPDGLRIVFGSYDSKIQIWDFKTRQMLKMITHHLLDHISALSLSPDGRRIVSGCEDGSVLLWDSETYENVGGPFVVGHTDIVTTLSFSPDGRHVVSGSDDTTIRIWSAAESGSTDRPEDVFPDSSHSSLTSSLTSVAYSSDRRRIISGSSDGTMNAWDADTGKYIGGRLKGHSEAITRIRFSPDGSRFVSASRDDTIRVWDSATLQPLGEPLHGHRCWEQDFDYSPDGRRIVSCLDNVVRRTIRIWDAETHECLVESSDGHEKWVRSVVWSPDGKRIASGSDDMTVRVWDAETGRAVGEPFRGHEDFVLSLSWSMDGRYVISSAWDGTIRFWDLEKGKVYHSMYPTDRRRFVSWGEDGKIRMWDVQTRKPVGENLCNPFRAIDSLSLSRDVMTTRSTEDRSEISTTRTFKTQDGWITDVDNNLVIWVPDEYRDSLLWRGMLFFIGREALTIDFANTYHGTEWAKCYQPQTTA